MARRKIHVTRRASDVRSCFDSCSHDCLWRFDASGCVTGGRFGAPAPAGLSPLQVSLYRAGHAHAGVLAILSLFLQIAIDYVALPAALVWPARWAALAAALLVSGGFFAMAYVPALRAILYTGVTLLIAVTLTVGIGLLKAK
ncbi:MAG TPA: hypothetical protein VKD65_00845 [Candidatus Angelobacter sp.]|nr:hypothetical protein [Candidatus Angelobacter sp.]